MADFSSKIIGACSYVTKGLGNWFQKNPEQALAITTVGSVVVKDGVGCYKYVTQSLKNDRIPEEKRKFVAALDLTNGVLMIAAQIALFFAMRKFSEPLFNKLFKKTFGKEAINNGISRIRMMQYQTKGYADRKLKLEKEYAQARKRSLDVFKFVAELAAATIVGKRIVVPLIATPLANKVQKKMEGHDLKKKTEQKDTTTEKITNETGKNLDITSSAESVNLKGRYKKYYGAIKTA